MLWKHDLLLVSNGYFVYYFTLSLINFYTTVKLEILAIQKVKFCRWNYLNRVKNTVLLTQVQNRCMTSGWLCCDWTTNHAMWPWCSVISQVGSPIFGILPCGKHLLYWRTHSPWGLLQISRPVGLLSQSEKRIYSFLQN